MKISKCFVALAAAAALTLSACGQSTEADDDDGRTVEVVEQGLDVENGQCQYDVEMSDGSETETLVDAQECLDAGVAEEDGFGALVLLAGMKHKSKGSTSLAAHGTSKAKASPKPKPTIKIKKKRK